MIDGERASATPEPTTWETLSLVDEERRAAVGYTPHHG
jgi:hypothetical protein